MPLRLLDYSDRELLHIVHEAAEENGGQATSEAIAAALGMIGKTKTQMVGARMAAMRRFELVDKDPERSPAEWMLTELGVAMAFGEMKRSQERAVDDSGPAEMLMMLREIAQLQRRAPSAHRHMLRREWLRSSYLNGR